jgi:nucleoid DNA-binding protein/DNA-directed RNA polymerase subunit RPC12/RpoP
VKKRITKAELVEELAGAAGLKKAQVSRVLKELATVAYREAANGFIVPGICKLSVIRRKERRCRIPSTGQLILIGARDALKIVPIGAAKNKVAPRDMDNITIIEEKSSGKPSVKSPSPQSSPSGGSADTVADTAAQDFPSASDGGSIVFACPDCGAMISAPASSAGADGDCPFCGIKIKIPQKEMSEENGGDESVSPAQEEEAGGFVVFVCQECGQEIECAAAMAGLHASCPTCGSQVDIPLSSPDPVPSASGADDDDDSSMMSSSMTMRIDLMDLE